MAQDTRVWTVLEILKWTTGFLRERGVDSPRLDAELMLADLLGLERIQLYVQFERPLVEAERDAFRERVRRRARREPVQYILGHQEFWSLAFEVAPGVLVPRGDTEVVVETALKAARALAADGEGLRILDVGTGTGAIAVALAHELSGATVVATDIMPVPLTLAPRNIATHGLTERVTVLEARGLREAWQRSGGQPFDLVVSNPPYIRAGDWPTLMPEVRDYEPPEALFAGDDGLDVLRELVATAGDPRVLRPGGTLVLEVADHAQAAACVALCDAAGLTGARSLEDLSGEGRAVVAMARLV